MFKNDRKLPIDKRKTVVSEKIINLSDLLKPNSFKNNLNSIEPSQPRDPFSKLSLKPEKLKYDKLKMKLMTANSLKNEDKNDSEKSSSKLAKVRQK